MINQSENTAFDNTAKAAPKPSFFYPERQVTIEADTQEEADKKYAELITGEAKAKPQIETK